MGQTNPAALAAAGPNEGLAARAVMVAAGRGSYMVMRPHLEIFSQDLFIPPTVSMRLTLYQARNPFLLKTWERDGAGLIAQINYRMEVMECVFVTKTTEVFPHLEVTHEALVEKGDNMRFYTDKVNLFQLALPAGQLRYHFADVLQTPLPERMLVMLVRQQALNGNYQQNPFDFHHHDLNYVAIKLNNELHNGEAFTPDFQVANRKFHDEYKSMYEVMGRLLSNQSVGVSYSDYPAGYTIFGFDLTPDGSAGACPNLPTEGKITIEFGFRVAPADPLVAIVYVQGDGELQIARRGEVLVAQ